MGFDVLSHSRQRTKGDAPEVPMYHLAGADDKIWMSVGNLCVAVGFAAVHIGVASIEQRVTSSELGNAFAFVIFPGLLYLVAYPMHLEVFVTLVLLLSDDDFAGELYVGVMNGVAHSQSLQP